MVINEKEKFIFIHIPKAAGTTITKFLLQNIDGSKKLNLDGDGHYSITKVPKVAKRPLWEYHKFAIVIKIIL